MSRKVALLAWLFSGLFVATISAYLAWVAVQLPEGFLFSSKKWIGRECMPRYGVEYWRDGARVPANEIRLPLKVTKVKYHWIGLENAWVRAMHVIPVEEAREYYTKFIEENPGNRWDRSGAYHHRGVLSEIEGDDENAINDYTRAIYTSPKYLASHYNRGNIWLRQGKYNRAIHGFNAVIQIDPNYLAAFNHRGFTWEQKGEYEKAREDYAEAIRINADFKYAYNNLAWLLATCPDASIRDGRRAVELATRACELSDWKDSTPIDTLAAAYAESGDFKQAVKYQERSLELLDKDADQKQGRQRLALYRAGKPYRVTKGDSE